MPRAACDVSFDSFCAFLYMVNIFHEENIHPFVQVEIQIPGLDLQYGSETTFAFLEKSCMEQHYCRHGCVLC